MMGHMSQTNPAVLQQIGQKVSRQDVKKKGKLAPELPRRKFFHAKYFPEIPLDLKKTSFLKGKVQFSIL